MKIKFELLEKVLTVLLTVIQAISRMVDKDTEAESEQMKKDVALADAVRTKFPHVDDNALLAEIAKANEINDIIDRA
jgi:hypothetical protein